MHATLPLLLRWIFSRNIVCAENCFFKASLLREEIFARKLWALLFARRIVLNVCHVLVWQATLDKDNDSDMNCMAFVIFSSLHVVDITTDTSFIYGELFIFAYSDNSLFIAWVRRVYYSVRIPDGSRLVRLEGISCHYEN